MTHEVKLEPCPLCGDKDDFNPSIGTSYRYAEPGDPEKGTTGNPDAGTVPAGRFVECDKCGCCGPDKPTEAEAITAWNTRPALREQEWQDISTAPKDGTRVLLATTTGGIQTGEWLASQHEWVAQTWDDWGRSAVDGEPTHWRPLPAPPSKGT